MGLTDIRLYPTYVINLDRRPERWNEFSKQPILREFKQLQRFSAVDGSKLDIMNDERVSIHTRHNIHNKFRRSDYEINTVGAIGATFSHVTLWQNFLKGKEEYLVVFEDDTIVGKKEMDLIDSLIPTLPESWDVWLLGRHNWQFKETHLDPRKPKGWKSVQQFTGAHGYVLSRRGAEILVQNPFPIETHIEYYISACSALKDLRLICHHDLRMKYSMELTKSSDSDTFDSYKSCPVCIVPDNFLNTSLYLSSGTLERAVISISALLIIAYGFYLRR
jgi:GR25 family glycosyltransferase involved in LPS biosynthesis